MGACNKICLKNNKICISSLKHPKQILKRSLVRKNILNPDYDEDIEVVADIWAGLETNKGTQEFNNVGINSSGRSIQSYTHKFYTRFLNNCDITSENWIEFKCNKYRILRVENLDEMDEVLILYAVLHGDSDLAKSNLA